MTNTWNEREEIIQSLSRRDRQILYLYEKEHGRLYPGAICKVIEDQRELAKEKSNQKRRKGK